MYVVKPYDEKDQMMVVSSSFYRRLDRPSLNRIKLQYGIREVDVTIHHANTINNDTIYLSTNVMEQLGLPLTSSFDLVAQGDKIVFGPYIGILCELTNRKLAEMITTYKSFVKGYPYFGGTIAIFSVEGIDEEKQVIDGFLYNAKSKSWDQKTFPFPGVVMSIAEPSLTSASDAFHKHMRNFQWLLGEKVFNYPHFSKWEMHRMLLPEWRSNLPDTAIYQDISDVYDMLSKHGNIYIKPLHGRLGKRIFNVLKSGQTITVKYEEKRAEFVDMRKMATFLDQHLIPNAFIIQETIPLKTVHQSVIDFRVMASKNYKGQWEVPGIYARYGATGHIVSNITAGGHTEIARKTLKEVWKLSDLEVHRMERAMERMVVNVIESLEKQGYQLGNIGVDLGLDEKGHLTLIEVNHQNPDPYIALMAKDRLAFYQCRFNNMMYARKLSGFTYKGKRFGEGMD